MTASPTASSEEHGDPGGAQSADQPSESASGCTLGARRGYGPRMGQGPDAGCASSSRAYRACTRLATGWLRFYTRGVDPRVAVERTVAVELELWEHALVADGWSSAHAAASLVLRTAAGVPLDLSWRSAARWEPAASSAHPVHLLVRRHRQRFWVPLRAGHVFDQTNGMAGSDGE